ncbi:MAG TPA: hypothetical protein VL171_16085 [Verrucomicrobiae bacterium]|nr:hypothetical protein [Verrucomicrobiae bacterium]
MSKFKYVALDNSKDHEITGVPLATAKLKRAFVWGLLILGQPAWGLRAENGSATDLFTQVVERQRSNESAIASVLIKGAYKAVEYGRTGQVTYVWQYDFFSFSRSNDLMRVLRRGHEEVMPHDAKDSRDFVQFKVDEIQFYSPKSTVEVDLGGPIAQRRRAERPQPYPLSFGYGLIYRDDIDGIESLASAWEGVSREGLLTVRHAPDDPRLLLAEVRRGQMRVRCWIDPDRGNIIVRRKADQLVPGSRDKWLVLEEYEIAPKQFGSSWFFEKAWGKRYLRYYEPEGSAIPRGTYLREEQTLAVSNFVAGATFKPEEFEFSTNSFPHLMVLQDTMRDKTIDLTTGQVIPTNAHTWVLHPERLPPKP